MVTRVQIAKPDIVRHFNNLPKKLLDLADIRHIFYEQHSFWRLASSMSLRKFIDFLLKNTKLKVYKFNFIYRPITKYTWGDIPFYELILSLKPNAYFTHYTAMYFHNLTDQIPKVIYLNVEQSPKPRRSNTLDQKSIDIAFSRATRISQNIAQYKDYEIRLLNGMQTGNLGVVETQVSEGAKVYITDVERTLIDIAVRPEYAGGVFEVLRAYKRAYNMASINRLSAMLKQINYIYPYHQAVGFYLEKAGYRQSQIDLLKKFSINYDFYLAHQITDREYSQRWRLFYPKGLK